MSGSLTWQDYTDDLGRHWAYNLDESNARAQGFITSVGVFNIYQQPIAPFPGRPPRGLIPRYVSTVNLSNALMRRDFVIFSRTVFNRIISETQFFIVLGDGQRTADYWTVIGTYNELYPSKPNYRIDTGLTDGTPEVG